MGRVQKGKKRAAREGRRAPKEERSDAERHYENLAIFRLGVPPNLNMFAVLVLGLCPRLSLLGALRPAADSLRPRAGYNSAHAAAKSDPVYLNDTRCVGGLHERRFGA